MPRRPKIAKMFGGISSRYDLINRLMSLGLDPSWRRRAAKMTNLPPGGLALDLCCGTADLSIEIARLEAHPSVTGLDLTEEMLRIGKEKVSNLPGAGTVSLLQGDAVHLPMADETFSAVTYAFGLRNIPDRHAALREARRVLRPGGRVVILEFSHPESALLRKGYHIYLRTAPLLMATLLGASPDAYRYLAASVIAFPRRNELAQNLSEAGLRNVGSTPLLFGTVAIHWGEK